MEQEVQISIDLEELNQMVALMEIGLLTLKTFKKNASLFQLPRIILTEESSKCMLEKYKEYTKILQHNE